MSDPLIALAQATSGPAGGTPAQVDNQPPADGAPQGEQTPQFDPAALAYGTQLPKRLLTPEVFAKLTGPGTKLEHLVDGYLSTQEKLNQLSTRTIAPDKDAKPEEWAAFYNKLGRPEKPDGYKFTRDGEFKDLPTLPGLDEYTAAVFHEAGLTPAQADAIFKGNGKKALEIMAAARTANEAAAVQGTKDLEALWGREAPQRRAELEQVAVTYFGKEDWDALMAGPAKNRASVLDKLAGLQKYMGDTKIRTGGGAAGVPEPTTPLEALKQALA